jgi:hypothetical protein
MWSPLIDVRRLGIVVVGGHVSKLTGERFIQVGMDRPRSFILTKPHGVGDALNDALGRLECRWGDWSVAQ